LAAPLIFSGDITRLDEFTLSLLTNDEVIDVDQDPLGESAQRVAIDGSREVWARRMEDGGTALGLFNRGSEKTLVKVRWSDLGITGPRIVRDLWRQEDVGRSADEFEATVNPHGVVMVRLRRTK
jgi:alpha-galactosidase